LAALDEEEECQVGEVTRQVNGGGAPWVPEGEQYNNNKMVNVEQKKRSFFEILIVRDT